MPTRNHAPIDGKSFTFIDVFAGCGGLSLGLMKAGWRGIFAIERDPNAFATLNWNLIDPKLDRQYRFDWPDALPKSPLDINDILGKYRSLAQGLADNVDMLVGGPPCQGFSSAGRRDPDDPRNKLTRSYLRLVDLLRPRVVIIENVRGITSDFVDLKKPNRTKNYADLLQSSLGLDFHVFSRILDVSSFGVPQRRHRFFIIAIRKSSIAGTPQCPFTYIESKRLEFLNMKGLRNIPIPVRSAISDLEVERNGTRPCRDCEGFNEIQHQGPRTVFQRLMNAGVGPGIADTRLARHRPEISDRFKKIIKLCHADGRLNVSLSKEVRDSFGLAKRAIRVLDPDMPSPTITSMPDDLIHYREPRCLTVRENARLQSFPDWFEFRGKYTTGGDRRRREVPRFTQVANAVPPLAAEAIGYALRDYLQYYDSLSCCNSFSSAS